MLLIILTSSCCLYGRDLSFRKLRNISKYHLITGDSILKPYYISKTPITNKEYVTYLCWIADVYGLDYPEVFLDAFPTLQRNQIDNLLSNEFQIDQFKELIALNELTRDYIFNPKYLNYPIVGLTWKQASVFLNWLSDRYNEYNLISRMILTFKPNLINKDSFNTESFLGCDFFGYKDVSNDPKFVNVAWHHRLLVPSFRLPSFYEIKGVESEISKSLKPYKTNPFLNSWSRYYLNIHEDKLILKYGKTYRNVVKIETDNTFCLVDTEIKEFYLDTKQAKYETDIFKIYSNYNQDVVTAKIEDKSILKDSLGHKPYIIIAEDDNLNPILIQRNYKLEMSNEALDDNAFSIFRYAISAVRK